MRRVLFVLEVVAETLGLEPIIRGVGVLLRSLINLLRLLNHLALEVATNTAVVVAHLWVGLIMRKVIMPRLCRLLEEAMKVCQGRESK